MKQTKIEIKSAGRLYCLSIKECLSGFASWNVEEVVNDVVVNTASFQQIVFRDDKVWLMNAKEKIKIVFQDGKEWMMKPDKEPQKILSQVQILGGFVLTTKNS